MGRLKLGRKVVIALFLLLSTFQFMISQFSVPVSAEEGSGANARMAANIAWGQKKSFQQMSTDDLASLTYEDLQMIGVFLSNFYIPWNSEIGKTTDEYEDKTKTSMVNALVQQCNFNKDVAEALVPMIWEMSLSTAKPLYAGVLDKSSGNVTVNDIGYIHDDSGNIDDSGHAQISTYRFFEFLNGVNNVSTTTVSISGGNGENGVPYYGDTEAKKGDYGSLYKSMTAYYNFMVSDAVYEDYGKYFFQSFANLLTSYNYYVEDQDQDNGASVISLSSLLQTRFLDLKESCEANSVDISRLDGAISWLALKCGNSSNADEIAKYFKYGIKGLASGKDVWDLCTLMSTEFEDDAGMDITNIIGPTAWARIPLSWFASHPALCNYIHDAGIDSVDKLMNAGLQYEYSTNSFYSIISNEPGSGCASGDSNQVPVFLERICKGTEEVSCLYWLDNGTPKPVLSTDSGVYSACQFAYCMLCDTLGYSNGMGGNALINVSYKRLDKLSDFQRAEVVVSRNFLYVDCFGNIFVDDHISQKIILPACVNPYTWYYTGDVLLGVGDKATKLSGSQTAGRFINGCNLFMLGEMADGNLSLVNGLDLKTVQSGIKSTYGIDVTAEDTSYYDSGVYKTPISKDCLGFNMFNDNTFATLFNTKCYRVCRGDESIVIDDTTYIPIFRTDDSEKTQAYRKMLEESAHLCNPSIPIEDDHKGYQEYFKTTTCEEHIAFHNMGYFPRSRSSSNSFSYSDNEFFGMFFDMVMIDNYNVAQFQGSSDPDSVLKTVNLFSISEGKNDLKLIYSPAGVVNKFGNVMEDASITTLSGSAAKPYLLSIYLTYVYAFYDESTGADRKVCWAFNKEGLPAPDPSNIDWSNVEIVNDMFTDEVMSLAYYFLHPLKGIQMIVQWFKNKVSAILVGWHEDMVGAAGGVATSGSTRYIGFSGYVTLPNLGDLPWTSWLLSQYDSLVVYFIIVILIIMLCYVMAGSLTVQRAMLGVLVFAICAYLPPKLIDSTVNMSNKVCDAIYSSKFTYWALAQHQQYASELKQAAEAEDKQRYLAGIFTIQADNAAEDYAIVTVKWQCPKKENYMVQIRQELNAVTNGNDNIFKLISGLVSSQISGEQYVEAAQNMYLYRSYTDIAMYSSSIWNRGVKTNPLISTAGDMLDMGYRSVYSGGYGNSMRNVVVGGANENVAKTKGSKSFANLRTLAGNYLGNYGSSESSQNCYKFAEENGFLFNISPKTNNVTNSLMTSDSKYSRSASHIFLGVSSPNISAAIYEAWNDSVLTGANLESRIKQASQTNLTSSSTDWSSYFKDILVGVDQKRYSRTLAQLNAGVNDDTGFCNSVGFEGAKTLTTSANFGNFGFELYSESPYYYFSANLYDQLEALRNGDSVQLLTTTGGNDNLGYKDLFLLPDGAYFYNMTKKSGEVSDLGYGEMRDYMDMRSLFYVTIPYLKAANDVVIEWDKLQGLWMYDDVELSYDENYALEIPSEISAALNTAASTGETSPLLQKFWHNANVAQLFNMYTPWVDLMYDCEYAKSENIYVAGEKYQVTDPLNPYSYYQTDGNGNIKAGRPMVFSRSEMNAYGLELDDLTKVETKIIKMYDDLYEDLLIIMDYYNFEDEVLNTGAAMLETFAFNKYFSESTVFGEDHVMYPQSYELKNFSYDAYLRMIMAEATGEDLSVSYAETTGGSLYGQIVQESSILTAIMFIVVDLFACYAIPALKLFFVIAIFTLSVIMILAATVKLEMSLPKVLWKSLVSPLLKFFGISIGMAFAVSLFMSDGNTAVTGRGGLKISLGDPVMTLIVMLLINAVVLILYWKTAKAVAKDCITYFKAVFQSIKGVMGGAVANVASTATGGKLSKFAPVAAGMAVGSALTRGAKNTTGMFARARSKRRATSAAKKGSVQANKAQAKADNKYNKKIAKYKGKVTTDQNSLANTTKASVAGFKSEHKSVDVNATSKGDLVRAHGELDKEIQLRKGNISKANAKRELLESRNKELEATGAKKGYNIDGKATSKAEAQWQAEMSENKSAMSEIDSFVTGEKATLAKCQTEKDAVHKKVAEMTATAKKNGNVVVNGSVADAKEKIKAGSAKVSDDVKNVSRMQRGTASKMSDAELEEAFKNNKSSFYSCQNQARACAKTKADIDSNVASQRAKLVENGYSEHGIARDGAEATAQDNLTIANACSRNSANAQKFAEGQMRVSAENARDVKREWVTRHQASRESGNYKFNNANAGNQTYKNFAYQGGASMNMSTVMGDVKNLGEVNYANANGVKKRAVAEISAQQESLNRANASVEAAQRAYEQALEKGAKNGWNRDAIGSFASGSAEREWQDEINGVEKALHSSKSSVRKLEGNISQLEKLSSAADARMTEIDNKYSGKKGKRR